MNRERLDLLNEKKEQIKDLSNVIIKYQNNIDNIEYQVYTNTFEDFYYEFIIITYKSGSFVAKDCTWNSFSANMSVISECLEGGEYYNKKYLNCASNNKRII